MKASMLHYHLYYQTYALLHLNSLQIPVQMY